MPLRRIFLLGAAALATVAALVAIGAILSGDIGETEGKIFATLAATFVAGSTAIAGVALLASGASRPLALAGIVLACGSYVFWAEQIWAQHDSDGYWKLLLGVLAWTLAALIAITNRLLVRTPRLVRTLYPATAAAAGLAAAIATALILREQGDGWQLLAILVILAVLGEILAPILERYSAAEGPVERSLGTVGSVEVLAVRGKRGTVLVGDAELQLRDDEGVLIRPGD
jgi:hypothetical protein